MSYFDDASLVMIPSGYKTSKVYSVKPTDGTGDLTFSRSNDTATRVNSAGLIEKVRTNLALYSEQYNNAYWSKYSSTITANTSETTDPIGGNAADILVSANATAVTGIEGNVTYTSGVETTISVYVKYKNTAFIQMLAPSSVTTDFVNFNIQTGAIVGGSYSQTPTITSVGNGWYRCSFTFVSAYSGTTAAPSCYLVDNGSATRGQAFTGDGVKAVYIFGAQVEYGVMTDYIATTSAAVSVGPVANVPRLDYLNSSCPRLLIEPQRTNNALYSEQLDNAAWTKQDTTVSANAITSPSGYQDADKLIETSATGVHRASVSSAATLNGTFSFFAKAGERTKVAILSTTIDLGFDLSSGTLIDLGSGTSAGKIENYGNGWYRCSLPQASGIVALAVALLDNSGNISYTGNGTSGAYFWGAQLEVGAYATSYIPTLGAAVTRGVDNTLTSGLSAVLPQTAGTMFWEIDYTLGSTSTMLMHNTGVSDYGFLQIGSSGTAEGGIYESGVMVDRLAFSGLTSGHYKMAFAYETNSFALYINGVLRDSGTSGSTASISMNTISLDWNNTDFTRVSQALLFPTRLSNSDLAALTA